MDNFTTTIDMFEALATLPSGQRADVETWYSNALWYAWGRVDMGELGGDTNHGWRFALQVASVRCEFINEHSYCMPGITDQWIEYRDAQ